MSESDYFYKSALNNIDYINISSLKLNKIASEKDLILLLNMIYDIAVNYEKTLLSINCMNSVHAREITDKLKESKNKLIAIMNDISKKYELESTFH
jgi:hypothetical protein